MPPAPAEPQQQLWEQVDFAAPSPGAPAPDLTGYTLVLPAVAVGNVGQLAADLVIATLRLPRAGFLDCAAVLPCVGAGAYGQAPGLALPLEVYADPRLQLAVVQQRAPAAPGLQAAFARGLAAWAARAGVARVWVLGSLDSRLRHGLQIGGEQLRFWAPEPAEAPGSSAAAAAAAPAAGMQLRAAAAAAGLSELEASWFEARPLADQAVQPWPLLLALRDTRLPAAALLCFASEGDNRPDAHALAGAAARVLPLPAQAASDWTAPDSWRWVFGAQRPLY